MLLLFGLRTRERLLSSITRVCEVCGVTAPQAHLKRSTKFTLFFIPVLPVGRSTHFVECAHCGARRRVDPKAVVGMTV